MEYLLGIHVILIVIPFREGYLPFSLNQFKPTVTIFQNENFGYIFLFLLYVLCSGGSADQLTMDNWNIVLYSEILRKK